MEHFFAYGTLMCDDIMQEVSGAHLPQAPAILTGYSRRPVKGEHYPALVPDAQASVEGVVYKDVPSSSWDRLDRFEGEMYARKIVPIQLNDGTIIRAATYVVRPAFMGHLEASEWDFAHFLRNGKASFQGHYKGYRSL